MINFGFNPPNALKLNKLCTCPMRKKLELQVKDWEKHIKFWSLWPLGGGSPPPPRTLVPLTDCVQMSQMVPGQGIQATSPIPCTSRVTTAITTGIRCSYSHHKKPFLGGNHVRCEWKVHAAETCAFQFTCSKIQVNFSAFSTKTSCSDMHADR